MPISERGVQCGFEMLDGEPCLRRKEDHVPEDVSAVTDHPYKGKGGPCIHRPNHRGNPCGAGPGNHREVAVELAEPTMSEGEVAFVAYAEAVQTLIRVKDRRYKGAWQRQGYMGNMARVLSKSARLEAMVWKDGGIPEDPESALDTLKDMMALCAFMAANIEDGNRWGHGK